MLYFCLIRSTSDNINHWNQGRHSLVLAVTKANQTKNRDKQWGWCDLLWKDHVESSLRNLFYHPLERDISERRWALVAGSSWSWSAGPGSAAAMASSKKPCLFAPLLLFLLLVSTVHGHGLQPADARDAAAGMQFRQSQGLQAKCLKSELNFLYLPCLSCVFTVLEFWGSIQVKNHQLNPRSMV